MGITIDKCLLYETCNSKTAICALCKPDEGCPIYRYFKELIIQNYNERLKADMVAMLTELQLDIEKKASAEGDWVFAEGERFCGKLIQQKINSLKVESEDK